MVFWVYFRDEQTDSHLVGETWDNGNASCHLLANCSAAARSYAKPPEAVTTTKQIRKNHRESSKTNTHIREQLAENLNLVFSLFAHIC